MTRKLPMLTNENKAFWQGGATGRLLVHRCDACTRWFHPPAPVCPRCSSRAVGAQPVSGRGRVFSYTINRQAWTPELTEPYVVAIVELVEQPSLRFVSNVVGLPVEQIAIGMDVQVRFLACEDVWIPQFEQAA